jgi:anti-sigma factor RsiW
MRVLSCDQVVTFLGDYSDGVLPEEDRHAVDTHLRSCARCTEVLGDCRRLPEIVRRATDIAMPVDAKARLRRLLSLGWRSHS